jgi:hypothetical protein
VEVSYNIFLWVADSPFSVKCYASLMSMFQPLHSGLNAYTVRFDPRLLDDIRTLYYLHIAPFLSLPENQPVLAGGKVHRRPIGKDYYLFSYNTLPLLWVSAHNEHVFALHRRFFDALGIQDAVKKRVDYEREIVMYAGFFIIGNRWPRPFWHTDFREQSQAYTLMTPLVELAPGHGQLLYEYEQTEHIYTYQVGEAIVFGDGVLHTTQPYAPHQTLRVMLSMTFGTDKWQYWPHLKHAVQAQSKYYVLPCGHVSGSCWCRFKAFPHEFKALLQR